MLKNISRILPFLIVTLLAIGGVELLYRVVEHYLLPPGEQETQAAVMNDQVSKPLAEIEKHQNYDVIVERNLFKTYLEENVPEQPVATNPLEGLEKTTLDLLLMGTITGPAGRGRAIILNKKENKQELYYEGDAIEGAVIKEIMRGKVILNYEGKDEVLDMSEAASMRPRVASEPSLLFDNSVNNPPPMPKRRVAPVDVEQGSVEPLEDPAENYDLTIEPEPLEIEDEIIEEEAVSEEAPLLQDGGNGVMEETGSTEEINGEVAN